MTGAQLGTIGVIVSIFAGLMGVYFLQRSSAREQSRLQREQLERELAATLAPVQAQLDAANRTIEARDRTIERLSDRVDVLEDELRRGRGYGDHTAHSGG